MYFGATIENGDFSTGLGYATANIEMKILNILYFGVTVTGFYTQESCGEP